MSGGGFMSRSPASSFSSTLSTSSAGQSRAEPEQTPQQRDEAQARRELMDANQLAADAKKLDQVPAAEWQEKRDQLAAKVEAFAARLQSPAHGVPSEHADRDRAATAGKIAEARATLEQAKPPRAVPPVTGEIEIADDIAAKSIDARAVIDWMAGLSRSERQAVWRRYQDAATGARGDVFARDLANYVGAKRIAADLRALATMTDRQLADWRARNDQGDAGDGAALGQSKPLDPLGQSRPLDPAGQSFADPTHDADHDGRADLFTAHATPTPAPTMPLGQSRPLDPFGQSRPLDPLGQCFADPTRDADHDGRADLFTRGSQPSPQAEQLAEAARLASSAAADITSGLLPTYAAALDALDLAGVHAAAVETIGKYQGAAEVRAQLRAQLAALAESDTPEHAADRGLLTPVRGALDAALSVAEAQLASGLGVQRFRGHVVMAGVAPIRLGAPQIAAGRLLQEVAAAEALIATAHEVAELVPTAAEASAAGVSAPVPHGAGAAAEKVRAWAGRPVHFAFLKAALADLGIWSQIESAFIPGDGRTLEQLDHDVGRQAARFGAMNDVGDYRADLAGAMLIGSPSRENVAQVLAWIESAAPDARGPILEDLQRRGLLDGFADRLSYAEAERLHDSVRDASGVRGVLRSRYGENPHTGDNTVSNGLGKVPLIGGALRFVGNVATFGFLEEHDASHRAMVAGEITREEYNAASWKALARAGAVGAISTVTGGAASAYVEGLTASLAARGLAGRIASNTAVGVAGGAAGNVGARAGSDLVDGELSSGGAYAEDALMGGAIGGGLGFGLTSLGAAAARYVPEHVKTPIHRLIARLPQLEEGEVYAAIRSLGERHSQGLARFSARAPELLQLVADGVVTLKAEVWTAIKDPFVRLKGAADKLLPPDGGFGPQLVGAGAGGDVRFTFTAEAARPLHVPGPDGPVLHVVEARRLGDDLVSRADDLDPLTNHLGDGPETRGLREIDPLGQEPHQKRLPVAKDIDPNVSPDVANSGFWADENARGNTDWYSDNQLVNEITGYKPIQFKDGYPVLDPYTLETVYLERMIGSEADFIPCDIELARRNGQLKSNGEPNQQWAKDYREANGLTWHHHQDRVRMQLVPFDLHSNIPHAGGASAARNTSTPGSLP